MASYEKSLPGHTDAVKLQDKEAFQMERPAGAGPAESKKTEWRSGNSAKAVGLEGGSENGGWRGRCSGRAMREEEGRCMSPEKEGTVRPTSPGRLSHQPGQCPEQGWYKGYRQQSFT